jgi:hypothetical protein
MKQVILVTLLLAAVFAQAAVKPAAPAKPAAPVKPTSSRPPVYQDDVVVNLPEYAKENTRIRASLDANIVKKTVLVAEGNAHNANLKTVTGYVDAWKSDIAATEKATKLVVAAGKTTRTQWNTVKETQNPNAKAPVKKAAKKFVVKKGKAKSSKKILTGSDAKKALSAMSKKSAKATYSLGAKPMSKKSAKATYSLGAKPMSTKPTTAKKALGAKPMSKKPTTAKKALGAKPMSKKPTTAKKALGAKPMKVKVAAKKSTVAKAKKSNLRRLQAQTGKTLESVNKQYRAQVDELEKNVNTVIVKLVQVWKAADKDDKDAVALQAKQNKTAVEIRTFLTHILEYIKWTQKTMANYAKLFKTKPDNVFKVKASNLAKKIRSYL